MNGKYRWISLKRNSYEGLEAFFREHEHLCTAPAAKFKKGLQKRDKVWKLSDESGRFNSLLLYSGRTLFPVFNGHDPVPVPRFMRFLLIRCPVYAIQGSGRDVHQLEEMLTGYRYVASDSKDFYLMKLDNLPADPEKTEPKLVIRKPGVKDVHGLYELHKQYEIEEVIPINGTFNPVSCRYVVESMMARGQVLVGELEGKLVAKVNINADSYTRYQIGGVFVDPAFRGKGYATQVVAEFCRLLISEGKGINLFVKKVNIPAVKVYKKLGFQIISDYRITYY